MNLYKQHSVIPSQQAEEAETPAAEPSNAGQEHAVTLAPTAANPHGTLRVSPNAAPATAATEPVTAGAQPADLWSNGRWAVTEAGLESRYVINDLSIEYVIEKERLLHVLSGTANVSMCAAQLAGKSWVDDPEVLIEALAEALSRHQPGQTVVDLAATREHAVREWHRTHRRRLDQRDGDAKQMSDPGASEGGGPPDDPWISDILHRVRRALVRHGVDPAVHSGGLHVNERLVLMATGGATDEEIAAAADRLKHEHVLRDEEPEEELPPEMEDLLQNLIDEEIDRRRGR